VKAWASHTLSGLDGRTWVQAGLGLVLLVALLWALPSRRAGEDGGHHGAHEAPVLDAFERAGVTELKEGQRGPGFRLARLDGGWATHETWKGRLVILNFWATWCTPCTAEMPTLEALWGTYRSRGLVVVGVSVDRAAPRALIDPYVRSLKLTFPILVDPESAAAGAWSVRGLPATFVIRPGGEVAGIAYGAREWDSAEMRALIERLLPPGRTPGS
jgi:peroxiredoxin